MPTDQAVEILAKACGLRVSFLKGDISTPQLPQMVMPAEALRAVRAALKCALDSHTCPVPERYAESLGDMALARDDAGRRAEKAEHGLAYMKAQRDIALGAKGGSRPWEYVSELQRELAEARLDAKLSEERRVQLVHADAEIRTLTARSEQVERELVEARASESAAVAAADQFEVSIASLERVRNSLQAELAETRRLLDPAVIACARGLVENSERHPDACCAKCAAGLADRDAALAEVARLREMLLPLAAFWRRVRESNFCKEWAVAAGLLVRLLYDPNKHRHSEAEPGDMIYVDAAIYDRIAEIGNKKPTEEQS